METALREYEFTLISSAQLSEGDTDSLLKKYEDLMTAAGGAVIRKNVWGSRKLAYPINKHFKGHYTVYDLAGTPESMAEAERLMRIDENVLRYLSVKLNDSVDVEQRKSELAAAEVAAEKAKSARTKEQ